MEADDDILRNWSVSLSWSKIEGHIKYETKFISILDICIKIINFACIKQ